MVTLMAALVLVLQIAMVAQRWIVTNIRIFAAQSFLLAAIAGTIAYFNHAPHIYIAAGADAARAKRILVPDRAGAPGGPHRDPPGDRADPQRAALDRDFRRTDAGGLRGRASRSTIRTKARRRHASATTRWRWRFRCS